MINSITSDTVIADASGIADDWNENALKVAGVITLATVGTASVTLTAALVPVQTAVIAGTGAVLYFAGDRQAKGLPINPFDKSSTPTDASAPAAA
jgi:hypothetical protein